MRILKIIKGTAADGPGLRNSIYVAGCAHKCPGCHNPESHDFNAGQDMTIDYIVSEVLDKYADISISGGDPMYQPADLLELCKRLKAADKTIWVWTGFEFEELTSVQRECLKYIDVLVDGPYMKNLRSTARYCGSLNQRILHLKNGEIDWEE